MRLRIVTPLSVAVDEGDVASLRAEDASGSFGVLPRHAGFLTSLAISVVSWRTSDDRERHCAVRGGVFSVEGGRDVEIATREAVVGDDLATLDRVALDRFRAELDLERTERVESARLELYAIRRIMQRLQSGRGKGAGLT